MANRLPQFIVIQASSGSSYLRYVDEGSLRGYLCFQQLSVFSPMAKIQVERASNNNRFVHLRFCHSNKYWHVRLIEPRHWLVALSNQPEEDTSKASCTLFEPSFNNAGRLLLTPVQSQGLVEELPGGYLHVNTNLSAGNVANVNVAPYCFHVVDWGSLVQLPKRVTFKGDNDRYLRAAWLDRLNYLQFHGEDPDERTAAHEVQMRNNGRIRIKSESFGLFWMDRGWIRAEARDNEIAGTEFWPVLISGNTIALRANNNLFCKRHSADNKWDVVRAESQSMTRDARFEVEELVLDRSIYNVEYQMQDARIYDEMPIIVGTGSAANRTDTDSLLTIRVESSVTDSYSFSNSMSVTTGVNTSISVGVPSVKEGSIEISHSQTRSFEWNKSTEEKITVDGSYTVTVPPRTRVRVNYVATRGLCNIPFTYTQQDRSSTDGQPIIGTFEDGIFNGVNYYSFDFQGLRVEPLDLEELTQLEKPLVEELTQLGEPPSEELTPLDEELTQLGEPQELPNFGIPLDFEELPHLEKTLDEELPIPLEQSVE